MVPAAAVYAGLVTALFAAIALLKPLAFMGIHTRFRGICVLGFGFFIAFAGWTFPAREVRIQAPRSQLDQFAPVYQFHEVHSIRVQAPRERVSQAIKEVTAEEILFFHALTWIRRFGRPGPESIVNPPERAPLLDVAERTGFLRLAEEPDREIVVGTAVMAPRGWRPKRRPVPEDFKTVRAPGFGLAAMNFLIEDAGPGACIVTTETRVYVTDSSSRRAFAIYWRTIYPGSALIRRMWLRAIKRRAEAPRRAAAMKPLATPPPNGTNGS